MADRVHVHEGVQIWIAQPVRKAAALLPISNELLRDSEAMNFRWRHISATEWAVYIARLVVRRSLLNSIGASRVEKLRLTNQIKRALRGDLGGHIAAIQ